MPTATEPWESLAPGSTWRGWWSCGEGPSALRLPVLAARGAEDGPTLLATGGVHGDEYEGPAAIHALFHHLDGEGRTAGRSLRRGTLVGLPVINVTAWEARTRVTPADGVNLNRVFPGSQRGIASPADALAHAVFERFVRCCDVLVDLHSGGAALVHLPLVGWYRGGRDAERLARGFGLALHPWIVPDVPGVLSYEANRAGKVAIGAEWYGGARLDPAGVAAYTFGLRRVLAALGMVAPREETAMAEGQAVSLDPRTPIAGDYQETEKGGPLHTPRGAGRSCGLWRAAGYALRRARGGRRGGPVDAGGHCRGSAPHPVPPSGGPARLHWIAAEGDVIR
jgi:predicted deacylase